MKKRIADLEKARSRSPRMNPQKRVSRLLVHLCLLYLLRLLHSTLGAKGGRGGNNKKSRKGKGKSASSSSQPPAGIKNFDCIMKLPLEFRSNFHEKFDRKENCYRFQKNNCNLNIEDCKFSHVCVGCGGSKP